MAAAPGLVLLLPRGCSFFGNGAGAVAEGGDEQGGALLELLDEEHVGGVQNVEGDGEREGGIFGVEEGEDDGENGGGAVDGDDLEGGC